MESFIPIIAEKLGIKIGKTFYLKQTKSNGDINKEVYILYLDGLHKLENGIVSPSLHKEFTLLCLGLYEIEIMPFKPRYNQTYYTFDIFIDEYGGIDASVISHLWANNTFNLSLFQLGLVFETAEEALGHKEQAIKTLCNNWFENSEELDD